ncbi:MAG: prepilin-type N-terminal cleavage/methylation domain-containing protein [Deltaproteobacteria bacterium]|nr:prepilin-type N-terminal cleavage/methylation domain-containing protein [Deltaproteobacteria bacterium]
MANRSKNKGFTLIELMIVVGIVAILGAVAITAFGTYVRRSRASEAASTLSDFRIKQEAYRATFHQYATVQTDGWAPATPAQPGPVKADWNPADTDGWRQLGAIPGDSVYFRYWGEAGPPGSGSCTITNAWLLAHAADITCLNDFWYGAVAVHDLDGNGLCEGFAVFTGSSRMQEVAESAANCPS